MSKPLWWWDNRDASNDWAFDGEDPEDELNRKTLPPVSWLWAVAVVLVVAVGVNIWEAIP